VFIKTSNGHNFCSGYLNDYYYICIWGRKKFIISWQPAKGLLRSLASQIHLFTSFFLFFIFQVLLFYFSKLSLGSLHSYTLNFCLKIFVPSFHDFRVLLTKFQVIWISFDGSCSSNLHYYLYKKATSCAC